MTTDQLDILDKKEEAAPAAPPQGKCKIISHLPAVIDAATSPEPDDEFKWDPTNEDIIVPEQRSIAVYTNRWGQVVIREESADDDDKFVIISLNNLPAVIRALQALLPADRKRP